MLTDILIPLNNGSRNGDMEIKMCLRSVEKHLSGVGRVIIVGEKPNYIDWNKFIHIPCKEDTNSWQRAFNIYKKILAGINEVPNLSDNFLFMNDDHFLLRDYIVGGFPDYHRGPIVLSETNQPQLKQMGNTIKLLRDAYRDTLDFDIHCPILFNKHTFTNLFLHLPWKEYGYGIKSLYANFLPYHEDTMIQIEDLKFAEPLLKQTVYRVLAGRPWFSTGDKCFKGGEIREVLEELYPYKSNYER